MARIFLGAALLHAMLLVSVLGSGLLGGPSQDTWRGLHDWLGPAATLTGLLVNLLVLAHLGALAASIRRVELLAGLPGRFHSRAVRNCRRVAPLAVVGLGLLGATSWLGFLAESNAPRAAWSLAHLGLGSVAIGYQGAALAVFAVAILGQRALTLALQTEVDRLRTLLPTAADSDPDPDPTRTPT